MPTMGIPSSGSPALPILAHPRGSASLAAAFPVETPVGFLFLEMVVVKVASDYYLQRFACSHSRCENPEPDPAAAELSALAGVGEHSAPPESGTETSPC